MNPWVRRVVVPMLVAAPATAHADRLLLESYVGNRPAEAARIMPLVRTIFEHKGFTTDPLVLGMMFHEHAYRPGLVHAGLGDMLLHSEQKAEDAFWNENYLKAISDLGNLIGAMRQNPLIFVREPKRRDTALRALVFYALACGRQARVLKDTADEAAKYQRLRDDTLAEVLRSYPSRTFSSKDFGSEGVDLLTEAHERFSRRGRGRIAVTTSDPDAQIYINEIVQGTAKVDISDFLPGVYRVLIVVPSGEARQYELEVVENQISRLSVDWNIDSILTLNPAWAGFKYPSEKEHALEATLVHLLAGAHTNAAIATTVTVSATRGRVAVTGTSYATTTGQIFRSGRVELSGNVSSETLLTRLAECMVTRVGDPCAEGVLPVSHPEYTPPPPPPKAEEPPSALEQHEVAPSVAADVAPDNRGTGARSWPKFATLGGSAALIATGAYLLSKAHNACGLNAASNCEIPKLDLVGGWGGVDLGIALGAFTAYWFYDDTLRPGKGTGEWLVVGGATALTAGVLLYALDQDPSPKLGKTYWDTAPSGVAIGALGLASIGVGAWAWTRSAHVTSMPTVSVSASHALISWRGGF